MWLYIVFEKENIYCKIPGYAAQQINNLHAYIRPWVKIALALPQDNYRCFCLQKKHGQKEIYKLINYTPDEYLIAQQQVLNMQYICVLKLTGDHWQKLHPWQRQLKIIACPHQSLLQGLQIADKGILRYCEEDILVKIYCVSKKVLHIHTSETKHKHGFISWQKANSPARIIQMEGALWRYRIQGLR